jgi:hypothetical protein
MEDRVDRRRDFVGAVAAQQLQHANVVVRAGAWPQLLLQPLAQLPERRRQLQLLEQSGVIQIRRLTLDHREEVHGFEHLFTGRAVAPMPGHHLTLVHQNDLIDIRFDRHRLERHMTRHAVAHVLEQHRLIIIRLLTVRSRSFRRRDFIKRRT